MNTASSETLKRMGLWLFETTKNQEKYKIPKAESESIFEAEIESTLCLQKSWLQGGLHLSFRKLLYRTPKTWRPKTWCRFQQYRLCINVHGASFRRVDLAPREPEFGVEVWVANFRSPKFGAEFWGLKVFAPNFQ